jgi:DNA-binding response OmpR family regulator
MRILIVDVSEESLDAVSRALSGQGYEITARGGLTAEEVLLLSPEILITEATPSDLSCCG